MKYQKTHYTSADNDLLTKGAVPIPSKYSFNFLKNINLNFSEILFDYELAERYKENYVNWITSSQRNRIRGLDSFKWRTHTNGTMETFTQFSAENHTKRFRCFKGEFILHRLTCRNNKMEWKFLEDGPIEENDAVIISVPFSDIGDTHPLTDQLFKDCNEMDVPVCVDCAYMVIARDIHINLDQPCIKVIAFSLSKGFWGLDKLRIGIRLQRSDTDDSITVCNKWNTLNMTAMTIGNQVFDNFTPDWLWDTYEEKYTDQCHLNNLTPTNCILFALGNSEFKAFNRGGEVNRVCLSNTLSDYDTHE